MYQVVLYDLWYNWDNIEKTEGNHKVKTDILLETEDEKEAVIKYLDTIKNLLNNKKVDYMYQPDARGCLYKMRLDYVEDVKDVFLTTYKHSITLYILWKEDK